MWPVLRKDGRYNINTCGGAVTTRATLALAQEFCDLATRDPSLLVKKSNGAAAPSRPQSRHAPHFQKPVKPRAQYGSLVHTKKAKKVEDSRSFAPVLDYLRCHPREKKTVLGILALAAADRGKALQKANEELQLAFDETKRHL